MSEKFTADQAEKLFAFYKKLQKNLDEAIYMPRYYSDMLRPKIPEFAGIIARQRQAELQSGTIQPISPEGLQMITMLRMAVDSKKTADAARMYKPALEKICENKKPVSVRFSVLKWAFTSGKKKKLITEAFKTMQVFAEGPEVRAMNAVIQDEQRLANLTPQAAYDEYTQDRRATLAKLYEAGSGLCKALTHVPELQQLSEKAAALQQNVTAAENRIDSDDRTIREAAEALAAGALLAVLREIPAEELNRNGSSFRVKALRDAGFRTIEDIYCAHHYELESVRGVSDDSARMIKYIAGQIASAAQETVKIRLNADRRTPAATNLVRAIYASRKRQDAAIKLKDAEISLRPAVDAALKQICRLQQDISDADWFFMEDGEKIVYLNSLKNLHREMQEDAGTYASIITAVTEEVFAADRAAESVVWQDFSEHTVEYYNILESIVPGLLGNDDQLYGLPEELAREIQEECFFPEGLLCTLRRYQEMGVKYILHQEKVLLGDEMGLGKTIQAIAAMVSLKNTGATHFMVVCPASVLPNWCKEIAAKSRLHPIKVHGQDRQRAADAWVKNGGVAVTTYETTGRLRFAPEFRFDMMIVDEAHYIKNPNAARTIHVKALGMRAERLLYMTGTALENRVDEMLELISDLQPSVAAQAKRMAFMSSAPQFRKAVAPVYYRRKREDVLQELPELVEKKEWCTMGAAEEKAYEASVMAPHRNYSEIRRVSWTVDCRDSCKAKRMREIIEEAAEDGRKIIVFSFFLDTIDKICDLLGSRCMPPIRGSVSAQRRQEIIDAFDAAPAGTVLAAQIQSGGTGLNIQSASVVILCEPQFKPSIENQAISRAYRMGQSRTVFVHRLLCEDSVDEKITEMLAEKQAVFDAFADRSEAAQAAENCTIDETGFGEIIQAEIERIKKKNGVA